MPALAVLLPMKLSLMGTLLMVSVFMLTARRYAAGKDASQLAVLAGVMLTGFPCWALCTSAT